MATESAGGSVSKGVCSFCKAELMKNKVTQHLKFCKQRYAAIAAQEAKSEESKVRLFHILAEGRYNPEYWLHFEMPASAPLWSVDGFLKAMWIDDLDHLSGFTINGTSYSYDYSDGFLPFASIAEFEEEAENVSEEEEAEEIKEIIEEVIAKHLERSSFFKEDLPFMVVSFPVEWVAEIKKPRPVDKFVHFLKEELARITKEERQTWKPDPGLPPKEQYTKQRTLSYQKMVVEDLIEAVEDRSMEVSLGRVLKVGQKFSYIYDYGSSTYINLRVIAEREGIVQNKKKPVQLLARNTAPGFLCSVCGKSGTKVAMGYFSGNLEERVYCDACAEEKGEELESSLLPIINSPRVGVL